MYNPKGCSYTIVTLMNSGKTKIPLAGPVRATNEDFVINIISVEGAPKADIGSPSDPYFYFWLEDSERDPRGYLGKSTVKSNVISGYYHCIRNLGAKPRDADALIVEMYDKDKLRDDFLGFAVISISELEYKPKVGTLLQIHN